MEIEKKNIAFVIFFFAIGLTFILIIYGINSKRDKVDYGELEEDKEEVKVKNDLNEDPDVQTLFEIFSKLDTNKDSLFIKKNKYTKDNDLSNEEKLFVVFYSISNRDYMNVDCGNLSDSLIIPESFACTKRSYAIHRGTVMARYDELFGYEKDIELNNFLTYIYDPESAHYIHFESKNDNSDDDEYDMPKAVLKEAYSEDGKLKIKYNLDYSSSGNSFYEENVILTFKKANNSYIFESKKVEINS